MLAFRRRTFPSSVKMQVESTTFIAPIKGWVQSKNLAIDDKGAASVLENFFPTTRGIRPRGGSLRHATIDDGVISLMAWRSGTAERMFASDADSIYNITAPGSPTVQPIADVTGQTSGFYSSTMFSTTGGDFLVAVNGSDPHLVYSGSAWAVNTPAITGINSADLSYVWTFKNRLFFIEKDTMNAWCLPVDSLGGAAVQISLFGVFKNGGSLLFGETWSVDAGDGMDDICVFVSTTGEVVPFAGTDPADPTNWAQVGRYEIGRPLGPNGHMRAGGDLVIMTAAGMVPLSAAMNKDPAALSLAAVTLAIEDEWRVQAAARVTSNTWCAVKWIARNMAIIGLPTVGASEVCAYVVNLLTGAWAKYTGWDISCVVDVSNSVYFGTPDGGVFLAEASGTDDGEPYFSTFIGRYDHLKTPTASKTAKMARMSWLFKKPAEPRVSFSFDYKARLPSYPDAAVHESLDLWDVALWDVGLWDQGLIETTMTEWRSVAGEGFALAPAIQITNSYAAPPEAELVAIDLLYEMGGVAV